MTGRLFIIASLAACLICGSGPVASAQERDVAPLPGRDAPAGVMDAMLHTKGEWMIGVRPMWMQMDGNRDGTDDLTDAAVFANGYEHVPRRMNMSMTMVDVMYGVNDRLTLTGTVPFVANSTDMLMSDRNGFSMGAHGIGDVRVGGLIGLWSRAANVVHVRASLSVPFGTVTATDDIPDCAGCRVDYPSQPGSGTWDFLPALTWVGASGPWSWGASWSAVLRAGENSEGYAFGNRHDVSFWGVRHLGQGISASLRAGVSAWGNIEGLDPELDPEMSPTQNPAAQGGRRVDWSLGFGWQPGRGWTRRHRLAVEVGGPTWQSLDGPQLATNWNATIAWQFWFRQ